MNQSEATQAGVAMLIARHGPIFECEPVQLAAYSIAVAHGLDERKPPMAAVRRTSGGGSKLATGVIPISGFLDPTWHEEFREQLAVLLANPSVGVVVLKVDSGGGTTAGALESAAAIRKGTRVKPIVASVTSFGAASAAFKLASQASEVVISPSAQAGSIGVFALHIDETEALKKVGLKISCVSSGQFKVETAPWAPLSAPARAETQRLVTDLHRIFISTVAAGRGTTVADVRANFGRGRMLSSKDAVAAGLCDRLGTFEETLSNISSGSSSGRPRAAAAAAAIEVEAGRGRFRPSVAFAFAKAKAGLPSGLGRPRSLAAAVAIEDEAGRGL